MNELIAKAKKIKCIIFDVDGVLTDGKLYFEDNGVALKAFNVRDGLGMKLLMECGIEVGIITNHDTPIVTTRMNKLGIKHVYLGEGSKMPHYEHLKNKLNLSDEQIAYVGDDLPDLPLIKRAGLGITVANAASYLLPYADWQTEADGGRGAVREIAEFLLKAQDKVTQILEKFT